METAPPVKPAGAREFTLRSVLVGLVVAAVIGASYPYIVLKLGFGPNISVVSAFFGYFALGLFCRTFNRWENNMVETAGTAAGQTAFMCTIMAAFDILSSEPGIGFSLSLTPLQTFLWLTTAGTLGVLLAVPMRQHFVVDEKLTYADGVAAAGTMLVLDSKGPEAKRAAGTMVGGLLVSAAVMIGQYRKKIDEALAIPLNKFSSVTGVGFSLSFLNLGSGMIIGIRICTCMLMGLVASWVIAPVLLHDHGIIAEGAKKNDILLWVMWPATGMLVAGGLTALFLKWPILIRTFKSLSGAKVDSGDFPMRWVIIGATTSATALVLVQYFSLGLPVWQTLVAIALTVPLMLVGLRVLGETNWGPISALSNLMQGVFGVLAPGNMQANMVASGVTGSVSAESEGLIQDYKAGYILGTTPKYLTYMQLMAIPVGAAAVSYTYPLLRNTYGLVGRHLAAGEQLKEGALSSPISQKWVGFAKILSKGVEALHPSALYALAIGVAIGVLLTVLEQKKEWRAWVPSPTGIGIGMLVPASAVATMFAGALVDVVWRKTHPASAEKYLIPLASGFIAGEALVAVAIPLLIGIGVLSS